MKGNGGAAFPRPAGWNGLNSIDEHSGNDADEGMTLRDYLAARAPDPNEYWSGGDCRSSDLSVATRARARWNYFWADAMLKARTE